MQIRSLKAIIQEEWEMSFIDHFAIVDDPRKDIKVKYDLIDVLFLIVSTVISCAEGWKDIE